MEGGSRVSNVVQSREGSHKVNVTPPPALCSVAVPPLGEPPGRRAATLPYAVPHSREGQSMELRRHTENDQHNQLHDHSFRPGQGMVTGQDLSVFQGRQPGPL